MRESDGPSDISIVIPHYGSYSLLRNCLSSLDLDSVNRTLVVEDGCFNSAIRDEYPDVEFLHFETNSGFAAACNSGLATTETDYIAFLNNDVRVAPGWSAPLLAVLEHNADVAACQPKILSSAEPETFDYAGAGGGYLDRYGYPFCRGRIFDTLEIDAGQYDSSCDVFWASGAAFMARTEDIKRVGGFDPSFFAFMEEIDLCWRLQALGKRIVYVPESVVYHLGSASWSAMPLRKAYLLHRNSLLMLMKNYGPVDLKEVLWRRVLLEAASSLFFLLQGQARRATMVLSALMWNLRHYAMVRGKPFEGARVDLDNIRGLYRGSIALRHFLGGVRSFTELHWEMPTPEIRQTPSIPRPR